MKGYMKAILAAMLVLCLLSAPIMPKALGEGSVKLPKPIPVVIKVTGTAPSPAETYIVRMQADNSSYPMPAGSSGGLYTLKITGAGSKKIPAITYTKMGVFTYTIWQEPGNHPRAISYDKTEYRLTVQVTRNESTNQLEVHSAMDSSATMRKPVECVFTNSYTTVTPTPKVTNPPGPPHNPTPTPVPTPTPEPRIEYTVFKLWNDDDNIHKTRPDSIDVILYADGVQVDTATVTGPYWRYTFKGLREFDLSGKRIEYTVSEVPVEMYTNTITGEVITNNLIHRDPIYTTITGEKTWDDDENADGTRPNYIKVRLFCDGEEVESRTVTAANDWKYTFQNIVIDDGYGNTYAYEVREDTVPGYIAKVDGYDITNMVIPPASDENPLDGMSEEDLEKLLELFDYNTPLWGDLLKTGDEVPMYPFIFGGIGLVALAAWIVLTVLNRRKKTAAR